MHKAKFITLKVDREIEIPALQNSYSLYEVLPVNPYRAPEMLTAERTETVYHRLSFRTLTGWPNGKEEDLNYYINFDDFKKTFDFIDWIIRLETANLHTHISELNRDYDRLRTSYYSAQKNYEDLKIDYDILQRRLLKNRIKSIWNKIKRISRGKL